MALLASMCPLQHSKADQVIGDPIHVEIFNNDLDVAATATQQIITLMQELGGFVDITDSRPLPGIEWTVQIDRDEAYSSWRINRFYRLDGEIDYEGN